MNIKPTKRAAFISSGKSLIAVEVSSGQIEIYGYYDDGMEKFLGYITDLQIPGAVRARATQALYSGSAETFAPIQLTLDRAFEA